MLETTLILRGARNLSRALLLLAVVCAVCLLPLEASAQDKGRLFVTTDVNTPVIRFLNTPTTYHPGIKLPAGTYVIQVNAEGYAPKTKTVTVQAGKDTRLDISLKTSDKTEEVTAESTAEKPEEQTPPRSGKERVFVRVKPEDARVRILNIGPSFEQGMELGPGEYIVEVYKDGLDKQVRTVRVEKGKDLEVSFDLTGKADTQASQAEAPAPAPQPETPAQPEQEESASTGKLYVTTTPKDARVVLPEVEASFSQGMALKPGEYLIQVSGEGFQTSELQAEVFAGKDTRVAITLVADAEPEPTPKPVPEESESEEPKPEAAEKVAKGKERLYVDVIPEDASIRILNIAPKYEQGIEVGPGKFEVEIKKSGYETQTHIVEVEEGAHKRVSFDLRPPEERKAAGDQGDATPGSEELEFEDPSKGKLIVNVDVEDATIKLMDIRAPFTQGIELAPGSYRVQVSKEGLGTKEFTAAVTAGKITRVHVPLQPRPERAEVTAEKERKAQAFQALLQQISDAELAKDLPTALQLADKAVELSPRSAQAYLIRGNLHFAANDFDKALKDYNRCIDLNPDNAAPYLSRGRIFVLREDQEAACYNFWKACALGHCEDIGMARTRDLCP
jgi:hypothetical protein